MGVASRVGKKGNYSDFDVLLNKNSLTIGTLNQTN